MLRFGTLKGKKASHMDTEKQMFGKQMLARPTFTREHREDFDQAGLGRFLPVYHTLIHIKL